MTDKVLLHCSPEIEGASPASSQITSAIVSLVNYHIDLPAMHTTLLYKENIMITCEDSMNWLQRLSTSVDHYFIIEVGIANVSSGIDVLVRVVLRDVYTQ